MKLRYVTNIDISGFEKKLQTYDDLVDTFWNPGTCIWGKENSFYELQKLDKYGKVFTESIMCSRNKHGQISKEIQKLTKIYNAYKEIGTNIDYVFRNDYITLIKMGDFMECIFNEFVEIKPLTDVSQYTSAQIIALINEHNISTQDNLPASVVNHSMSSLSQQLEQKKAEIQAMKDAHKEQLEQLRQEQQRQMDTLRETLLAKQQELLAQQDEMFDQIFILEDKIMDLRCVLGESYQVINIKKGARCPKEQPIIVYQKMRYLEDEIVRLSSIGAAQFTGNHKFIEHCLRDCSKLLDVICPTEKCICVCRVTENNKYFVKDVYTEMFDNLELMHGKQLCIIIRDGEQIDAVWVDEDILVKGNAFISPGAQLSEDEIITEETKLRSYAVQSTLNRKYLLLIIQVLINNKIINVPDGAGILNNSKYIILSNADGFIFTNKYPNLSEYVRELNEFINCKVGDKILVVERAVGSNYDYRYGRRECTSYRGNGYNDKAHDAYLHTGLNTISLIKENDDSHWNEESVYVSCEKEWSDTGARANVRLYSDEFINLTFVSSNHIKFWIDSKKISNFSVNSYAQLCTLLKGALNYVEEREQKEFEFINQYTQFEKTMDNIDKLTEWKWNNRIRRIHSKNIKKFIEQCVKNR